MTLRVGAPAPDFELGGIDGQTGEAGTYRRSDALGSPLVLVFYPADGSPVCTRQLNEYTEGLGRFDELGARVFGISPQSTSSHAEFASQQGGFGFPLLSDTDKAVGGAYEILGLLDLYRRSIFIVDATGSIVYVHRSLGPGLRFKPIDELIDKLRLAS
jgi:peroxiredoxin Q/BCP